MNTILHNFQLVIVLLLMSLSAISWIYKQLKDQAGKKRARDSASRQAEEMLRTGRRSDGPFLPTQTIESQPQARPAQSRQTQSRQAQQTAADEHRRAQLEELRRRAEAKGARPGQSIPEFRPPAPPMARPRPGAPAGPQPPIIVFGPKGPIIVARGPITGAGTPPAQRTATPTPRQRPQRAQPKAQQRQPQSALPTRQQQAQQQQIKQQEARQQQARQQEQEQRSSRRSPAPLSPTALPAPPASRAPALPTTRYTAPDEPIRPAPIASFASLKGASPAQMRRLLANLEALRLPVSLREDSDREMF
ncbi:MAG: hypothetical protein H7Y88_00040 [Phycisphaerales bacterium]|nr:hypothetical protein [Phycisphaerales bacterium]